MSDFRFCTLGFVLGGIWLLAANLGIVWGNAYFTGDLGYPTGVAMGGLGLLMALGFALLVIYGPGLFGGGRRESDESDLPLSAASRYRRIQLAEPRLQPASPDVRPGKVTPMGRPFWRARAAGEPRATGDGPEPASADEVVRRSEEATTDRTPPPPAPTLRPVEPARPVRVVEPPAPQPEPVVEAAAAVPEQPVRAAAEPTLPAETTPAPRPEPVAAAVPIPSFATRPSAGVTAAPPATPAAPAPAPRHETAPIAPPTPPRAAPAMMAPPPPTGPAAAAPGPAPTGRPAPKPLPLSQRPIFPPQPVAAAPRPPRPADMVDTVETEDDMPIWRRPGFRSQANGPYADGQGTLPLPSDSPGIGTRLRNRLGLGRTLPPLEQPPMPPPPQRPMAPRQQRPDPEPGADRSDTGGLGRPLAGPAPADGSEPAASEESDRANGLGPATAAVAPVTVPLPTWARSAEPLVAHAEARADAGGAAGDAEASLEPGSADDETAVETVPSNLAPSEPSPGATDGPAGFGQRTPAALGRQRRFRRRRPDVSPSDDDVEPAEASVIADSPDEPVEAASGGPVPAADAHAESAETDPIVADRPTSSSHDGEASDDERRTMDGDDESRGDDPSLAGMLHDRQQAVAEVQSETADETVAELAEEPIPYVPPPPVRPRRMPEPVHVVDAEHAPRLAALLAPGTIRDRGRRDVVHASADQRRTDDGERDLAYSAASEPPLTARRSA
ncbi:hypothetical protein [Marinivivus vitaminiproducens]|uniref:hypothetical protein n=1 Tax=Marinivivus vitaminiproducens TaxID=3035935 RepID=UPI0027A5E290|nr:hypothetical protein P4R82_17290 [Geminicoccaceae bacterium SCSIO 64248]